MYKRQSWETVDKLAGCAQLVREYESNARLRRRLQREQRAADFAGIQSATPEEVNSEPGVVHQPDLGLEVGVLVKLRKPGRVPATHCQHHPLDQWHEQLFRVEAFYKNRSWIRLVPLGWDLKPTIVEAHRVLQWTGVREWERSAEACSRCHPLPKPPTTWAESEIGIMQRLEGAAGEIPSPVAVGAERSAEALQQLEEALDDLNQALEEAHEED